MFARGLRCAPRRLMVYGMLAYIILAGSLGSSSNSFAGNAISPTSNHPMEVFEHANDAGSVPIIFAQNSGSSNARQKRSDVLRSPLTVMTAMSGVVGVIGLIESDGKREVALEAYNTREVRMVKVGDSAFGYRVNNLTDEHAILESGAKKFKLRVGQYISISGDVSDTTTSPPFQLMGVNGDAPSGTIPDLAAVGNVEREQRFNQWRHALSTLPSEEQQVALSQMRDYWRQNWEGAWGQNIRSTMSLEEQESVRRKISYYWQN